jgi:hypothetical protein
MQLGVYAVFKLKMLRAKVWECTFARSLNHLIRLYCLMCRNFTLLAANVSRIFFDVDLESFQLNVRDGKRVGILPKCDRKIFSGRSV